MATEGIILDAGAIYKRLFNHRAVVQNEVQYFVQEFESKRGDNDLKLLQSSVKASSDINALYLEEMKESLPLFALAKDKMADISSKGNDILEKSVQNFELPKDETDRLDKELQELKSQYAEMKESIAEKSDSRIEELKAEIQVHKETIERLKMGGAGARPPSLELNEPTD